MTFADLLTNQIFLNSLLRAYLNQAQTLKELQDLISDLFDKQRKLIRLYNQCKQLKVEFPYGERNLELHLISHGEIDTHINKNLHIFGKPVSGKQKFQKKKKIKKQKWIDFEQPIESTKAKNKAGGQKKFKKPYARIISTPMYG